MTFLIASDHAEAQVGVRYSGNVLVNGEISTGPDPWEPSPFFFLQGPTDLPTDTFNGNRALSLPIFERSSSFKSSCTAVGARQIVDIDDQTLQHETRLRWRLRIEGVNPSSVGVAVSIGADQEAASVFTSFDFTTNSWDALGLRPAAADTWVSGEITFTLRKNVPVDVLRLDIMPMINTTGGICRGQVLLDDIELATQIADAVPGSTIPKLLDLPDDSIAGTVHLINAYRALAGAQPVAYSAVASDGARRHAQYMVFNGFGGHFEVPGSLGFSDAGDEAARTSSLCSGQPSLAACAQTLLTMPYHRFSQLQDETGFGRWELQLGFQEKFGVVGYLNGIDSNRDAFFGAQAASRAAAPEPLIWPANGVRGVAHDIELIESPDPLLLCAGAPLDRVTGYPITVEVPFATSTTAITDGTGTLRGPSGASIPLCTIDAQIPHPQHAAILSADAPPATFPGKMIFIPLVSLEAGQTYTFRFSATLEGQAGVWTSTFSTAGVQPLKANAVVDTVPFIREPGRVSLQPNWNLVGFGGDQEIDAATAGIASSIRSLFAWDAVAQAFQSYIPDLPTFLNTLGELGAGDGVWLFVENPAGVIWDQPAITTARDVTLQDGFNLVMWSGPTTDVASAVADLGASLQALFLWDAVAQEFLTFNPVLPPALNTATTVHPGDGVWVLVSATTTWQQPAP